VIEGRQVGFWHALNWSIGISILPAALAAILTVVWREASNWPAQRSFARNCEYQGYRFFDISTLVVLVTCVGLIIYVSVREWRAYCYLPLCQPNLPPPVPLEADWSIAACFYPERIDIVDNRNFSLIAFLLQALSYGLVIAFVLSMIRAITLKR